MIPLIDYIRDGLLHSLEYHPDIKSMRLYVQNPKTLEVLYINFITANVKKRWVDHPTLGRMEL